MNNNQVKETLKVLLGIIKNQKRILNTFNQANIDVSSITDALNEGEFGDIYVAIEALLDMNGYQFTYEVIEWQLEEHEDLDEVADFLIKTAFEHKEGMLVG